MVTRLFFAAGRLSRIVCVLFVIDLCAPALADGRLLGTGGATTVEGASGGGLVPWATLAGYGTKNEMGLVGAATAVRSDDYNMSVLALGWTWHNRVEISLAQQDFDIGVIAPGASLRHNDDYVYLMATDERMAETFAFTDFDVFQPHLYNQVCEIAGGPCQYTGSDMVQAHKGIGITEAEFNASVELLQKAMNDNGTPLAAQNRLLALLAPMQSDVIEK
ncbi:MAG: DUF3034 family protein [Gammaproteobacteria bacterium]